MDDRNLFWYLIFYTDLYNSTIAGEVENLYARLSPSFTEEDFQILANIGVVFICGNLVIISEN